MSRLKRWRWWVGAAVVVVVIASMERRSEACLFGACDGLIIANQVVQIGHMVNQVSQMVEQLQSLDGIMDFSGELIQSDDIGMGNIGRMRDMMDRQWEMAKNGTGLTTAGGVEGAFLQRIPGVTDAGNWLEAIAPGETSLLGTRPGTAVSAGLTGAFDTWLVPDEGANLEVLGALEEMASGTESYRTVWEEMEAAGTVLPLLTDNDIRALSDDPDVQDGLIERRQRAEAAASARLVHAHADADAASALARQVGQASAALADLRQDDLMREQRVAQAQLASQMAVAELAIAQGQVLSYEVARAAREQYEAERARRQQLAEWQQGMVEAIAEWDVRDDADALGRANREAAHEYFPSASDWAW